MPFCALFFRGPDQGPKHTGEDHAMQRIQGVGRQHGNGDHPAGQAALPGVLAHDVAVVHPIRAADLKDAVLPFRQIQSAEEVIEHVFDSDGLRRGSHPLPGDPRGE